MDVINNRYQWGQKIRMLILKNTANMHTHITEVLSFNRENKLLFCSNML